MFPLFHLYNICQSDFPSFEYSLLWEERVIRSVANLMRSDGEGLMQIAPKVPVKTEVTTFPLSRANEAMDSLRKDKINGAAVLTMIERQHPKNFENQNY